MAGQIEHIVAVHVGDVGHAALPRQPDRRAVALPQRDRVDAAAAVDLGGDLLTNGDGLLLEGRRLYAVQNRLLQVAAVRLDASFLSGTVRGAITSPDFDVPTTVARFGPWLYLPNARFGTEATPDTDYWVTRVRARC